MNEIEEIVRDRIVIELERLKRELEKEVKRLKTRSEFTDDTSFSISLDNQIEGIEIAIDRIGESEERTQRGNKEIGIRK